MRFEFTPEVVNFLKESLKIAAGGGEATLACFEEDGDTGWLIGRKHVSMPVRDSNALYAKGWKWCGSFMEYPCKLPRKLTDKMVDMTFVYFETPDVWRAERLTKTCEDLENIQGSFEEVWNQLLTF